MPERALSLTEAAALLGWSRRTLIRALVRHGVPTIGRAGQTGAQGSGDIEGQRAHQICCLVRGTQDRAQKRDRANAHRRRHERHHERPLEAAFSSNQSPLAY